MTLAIGWANLHGAGVMADSRLMVDDSGAPVPFDYFVKALELSPRTALVMAGSTLPAGSAAAACSMTIRHDNQLLSRTDDSPLSLWDEACMFAGIFRPLVRATHYAKPDKDVTCSVVLAGSFSDGIPGLVVLVHEPAFARETQIILRPNRDEQFVCWAIGNPIAAPLVAEAARRETDVTRRIEAMAGVIWAAVQYQGEPLRSVGGGLSIGVRPPRAKTFQWPMLEIDDKLFLYGLRSKEPRIGQAPLRVEANTELFGELERKDREQSFQNKGRTVASAVFENDKLVSGDGGLQKQNEPSWSQQS